MSVLGGGGGGATKVCVCVINVVMLEQILKQIRKAII